MNEKLMAEDVLRPYGITLYYKGCEYLRDAIVLHWHRPDLKPGQLLQYVADRKGVKKSGVLSAISTISSVAWKVNGIGGEKPMSIMMICPLSSRQVKYLKVSDKNTYISFWSVGIFMHTISLYIF